MARSADASSHPLEHATAFTLRVQSWKRPFLEAYFPTTRFVHLPFGTDGRRFVRRWAELIVRSPDAVLLVWGATVDADIAAFARENAIGLYFLEDGFVRSLVRSASRTPPLSLTIDGQRPYFDCRGRSDLEDRLNGEDCSSQHLARARAAIARLVALGITKYNGAPATPDALPVADGRRRVLVLGQVEDDQSIRYGTDRPITNNDLVRLAAAENDGARILYRPHPDVLSGVRRRGSDPAEVAGICDILTAPLPLPRLLGAVDHVYTITSLGGFEALLRGLPVTTLGCPFYAGWGLTDDRQTTGRRLRRRSVEELFAIAYLDYPLYFDAATGARLDFEGCLDVIEDWWDHGVPARATSADLWRPPLGWHAFGPYGLMGWRHLMTPLVAPIIERIGGASAASDYRCDPIAFFRELEGSYARYRRLGRLLYPFGD